jgi:hypothetical protein
MNAQDLGNQLQQKVEKLSPECVTVMPAHQVLMLALLQNMLGILVTQSHQLDIIIKELTRPSPDSPPPELKSESISD